MFGDSLMGQISMGLGRLVRDDPRVHIDADYHVSTGLARPDVLDWPAYLAQQIPALNPEVVYLSFGGNDDQDMQLADGSRVSIHTTEWRAEYSRRVALAMDVAAQGDRTVVWLGLPAERPERLHLVKDTMNEVAREQAAIRPRVVYIDLGAILTPDGGYRDDFTFPDGSSVRVRETRRRAPQHQRWRHGGAGVARRHRHRLEPGGPDAASDATPDPDADHGATAAYHHDHHHRTAATDAADHGRRSGFLIARSHP